MCLYQYHSMFVDAGGAAIAAKSKLAPKWRLPVFRSELRAHIPSLRCLVGNSATYNVRETNILHLET